MKFNPLKEKGLPLEKQLRTWHDIAHRKYNKTKVDCYTRTRQILMNGIEVEAWNFKHNFARNTDDVETLEFLARTKRIEDAQQTTINWLAPCDQSVLETTLGYEQVAVDLTAWMAQNEPDDYVKETFDFGLLEDFDLMNEQQYHNASIEARFLLIFDVSYITSKMLCFYNWLVYSFKSIFFIKLLRCNHII